MRVLLVYPQFPKTFWSYEKVLELVDRKVLLPPLGLVTVAAILPQEWEFKLVDQNIRPVQVEEWQWADLVILSAMIVQKDDMQDLIVRAHNYGKPVLVGGPYPTALPEEMRAAGADFLVLDEGEITLPLFVEAWKRGERSGEYRSEGVKPDVTSTPIPRFDLLDFSAYDSMSIQFSRGCPFQCEFCDIIVLYGRKPRTKTPEQLIKELNYLYELGWRRSIFMVDDNFIGNKRNVKLLLPVLQKWQEERNYPFAFTTEASVDLAQDQELLDMMVACRFEAVFLGIETPDADSLSLTKKYQNTRDSLSDAVDQITAKGIRVMAGFIIGFDNEVPGAGQRIVEFVEKTGIPSAMFGMLQALPGTALWFRLEKEGRLLNNNAGGNQTHLMNFVPTRPIEQIAQEYVDAFTHLYEPHVYLKRIYRYYLKMNAPSLNMKFTMPDLIDLRALATVIWRQGVKRSTRWLFWQNIWGILRHNPAVLTNYLLSCAHNEHFLYYRDIVKQEIEFQLLAISEEEVAV